MTNLLSGVCMQLKIDYSNVMNANIGNKHGLAESDFDKLIPAGKKYCRI